jgi:magnesium transporter
MDHSRKLEIAIDSARKFTQMGSSQRVVNLLRKFHPADVVSILAGLGTLERLAAWKALRAADPRMAAEVLTEMPDQAAAGVLGALEPSDVASVLRSLPVDDAAHLVRLLPDDVLEFLQLEEEADRTISPELVGHLAYREETAGRLMVTNVLAVPEHLTVGEATRALQERGDQFEMVFYLYVVDDRRHLIGVISLRQLILNLPPTPLRRIMADDVISVRTSTDQEEVAQTIARYNLLAVPVVDDDNRLVGIITVDDAIDVLREEATEDIYALAGVSTEETVEGNPFRAIRLRLPWLMVNLGTALVASSVIRHFQDVIDQVIVLATLQSVVAGIGGNAGTQTLTVVVRGMALGEIATGSGLRVLGKEFVVGAGNGLLNGCLGAIVVATWFQNVYLGLVMGLAMLANIVIAGIAGTVVPLTLRALRLDPATSSSVFVTAATDMIGFGTFLGLATLFLDHLK